MPLANIEFQFTNQSFPVGDSGPLSMPKSNQGWTTVEIDVDRTVAGGLNSLTTATVCTITFQFQNHPQNPWQTAGVAILNGGMEFDPARLGGGVHTTDTVGFSVVGQTFPPNTNWQLLAHVDGPSPVVASGTVSWQ